MSKAIRNEIAVGLFVLLAYSLRVLLLRLEGIQLITVYLASPYLLLVCSDRARIRLRLQVRTASFEHGLTVFLPVALYNERIGTTLNTQGPWIWIPLTVVATIVVLLVDTWGPET